MNKIFKVIWDWTRSQFSVVAENKPSHSHGKEKSVSSHAAPVVLMKPAAKTSALSLAICLALSVSPTFAKTPIPSSPGANQNLLKSDIYLNHKDQFYVNKTYQTINRPDKDLFFYLGKNSLVPEADPDPLDGSAQLTVAGDITSKDLYIDGATLVSVNYTGAGSAFTHDLNHSEAGYIHVTGNIHTFGDFYLEIGPLNAIGTLAVVDGSTVVEGSFVSGVGHGFFNNGLTVKKAVFHGVELPSGWIMEDEGNYNPTEWEKGQNPLSDTVAIYVTGDFNAGEYYSKSPFSVSGNATITNEFQNKGNFTAKNLTLNGTSNNSGPGTLTVQDTLTVNPSGSLLNDSGTLDFLNSSNVFTDLGRYDYIPLNVISVEARNVESANSVTSEKYKQLVSGVLNQDFADKVKVTGGKVIIENVVLSDEQIADLQRIFREKYPQATLEIKTSSKTNDKTGVFNVETVNALYDEKSDFQNVTFFENALKAENKALTVGDSDGNLKHSTGFKGIENAESITVNDGKSLELVGEKGESSNFFMAAVKTVVNAASKLILGSKGLSETYSGKTKEVQLANSNATLQAAAGKYEVEKVTGNGKIEVENGADLTLGGAEHTGEASVKGTLSVAADASLGTVNLGSESVLNNSHNLKVTSLTNEEGAVYNQTDGKISADSGWFDNATINLSGGTLDASEFSGADAENKGLGNNTFVVSGAKPIPVIHAKDTKENKANWKSGLTLLSTPKVTGDTHITLLSGGVLKADKLDFDGIAENTLIISGGALETQLDQVFNDVKREDIEVSQDNEQYMGGQATHVLAATTVGKIKDEVKKAIQGNSGLIVFNDENVKMQGIVQAMKHFSEEASNPGNFENEDDPSNPDDMSDGMYLAFTGAVDGKLTVDLANEFVVEQRDELHSTLKGVVLSHTSLWNESTSDQSHQNKDLVIGKNVHQHPNSNVIDVNNGIGFLDVRGAETVHVEEGRAFELTGEQYKSLEEIGHNVHETPDSELFTNENALIKNDQNTGGKVEVTGKFLFGTRAAEQGKGTIGWINDIQIHDKGQVEANAGEFAVWNINNEKGGYIHIGPSTVLHSHNYSGEGNWLNEGQIYLSDDHKEHSHLESQDFEIKGKFENAVGAIFSSEQKNNTIVENELDNKGVGLYSVLTVNGGGKSTNDGIETAESLVVKASGSHTIGSEGVSAFKKASVGGEVVNNGDMTLGKKLEADLEAMMMVEAMSLDGDTGFEVLEDGKFTNTKNLDARLIATSDIKGQLSNTGHALYSDMVVGEHGSSTTNNYEKGEWLTVKGSHSNSAISIWNKLHVKSKGNEENSGQQQLTEEFVVEGGGNYTNTETGELDATQVPTTEVSGNLVNKGKAWYDDMTIHDGGVSNNTGYEQGDIKKVEQNGKHTNSGTSLWNELDVAGEFDNTGTTQTDKFTLKEGGLAQVGKGELSAKDFAAEGGDLVVGNDLDLSAENRAKVELQPKGDIDTNIYVKKNGDLGLGEGSLDFADNLPSLGIPDVASRLVVTGPVTTGKGGGIAVGPDVWTDKDHHVDVNNGDLFFANGSYTVVDSNQAHEGTIFSTSSDNAKVTVEDGATLVLGGVPVPGDYYIVHGFTTQPNVDENSDWIGGWTPGDNLYVAPNGMAWDLTLHHDEDDIWVHVESRLGELDLAIPNIAEEDFNNWCRRPDAGADTKLICGVLTDPNLSVEDKQKVLNSVANLPTIGGAMTVAMQSVNNAGNSADGRASFTSDVFDEYGDYNIGDTRGNNLWIDVIGGWNQSKHLNASGGISAGYKTDSYGFVMGYDHIFADQKLLTGMAFSFDGGKLNSKGSVLPTSNKFHTYGIQVYGGWHPAEHFNLIGSIGMFFSKSNMEQNLGGLAGFNKAKADAKTTLSTISVKAESPITLKETVKIVPHIGVRYTMGKTSSYWTKLDGENAFHNKPKAVNTVQFPIGVSYRGDFVTENGWDIRPKADLSLIPQAGNKQKTKVFGASAGSSVTDEIQGEFSGKFGTALSLGVQANKGNATIGLNYGLTFGDKSRFDHQIKLEARWRF